MRRREALYGLVVCSVAGCNRGGEVSPTAPVPDAARPVRLTVLAARTGNPVSGAAVSPGVAALTVTTDGAGAAMVQSGATVTVTATPGFITPSVLGVKEAVTLGLWPNDAQMPEGWLQTAIFHAGRLRRPAPGTMTVHFSDDALADRWAGPASAWALDALNRAQSRVTFIASGPGAAVSVYTAPDDPIWRVPGYESAWAVADATLQGDTIVGGRIKFRFWTDSGNRATRDRLPYAMAHELGHIMGLGHPAGGIMGSSDATGFSARESEVMALMFLRPPGTVPPDNSAAVTAAAAGTEHTEVCVLR